MFSFYDLLNFMPIWVVPRIPKKTPKTENVGPNCHIKLLQECPRSIPEDFGLCCFRTTVNERPRLSGQPYPVHLCCPQGHWLRCQVHRSWSCHRWSRRIWSRNRIRFRITHHRIRPQPLPQATAFLIRHPGIRPLRSHGSLLLDDGFPPSLRLLNTWSGLDEAFILLRNLRT